MDLAAVCEVLKAVQSPEGTARKAAEQKLDTAASDSPAQLVRALQSVLAAGNGVVPELRQEASVILRQLILGSTGKPPVWEILDEATQKALQQQLLVTMEKDANSLAKRSAGQVAYVIAEQVGDDFDAVAAGWPDILPTLSRLVSAGCDSATRVVALGVLKDLAGTIGDGLLAKSDSVITMLSSTIADPSAEVASAGAQFVLAMVEKLAPEEGMPLAQVMPALIVRLQSFANELAEEPLKDTLTALTTAIEEEPDFFKDNCLKELWATLVKLCESSVDTFADASCRHQAMEAATSLAVGLAEDYFVLPEGQPLLEHLVALNIQWMLDVEEDVQVWTEDGRHSDEDVCDGEGVLIGEGNLDELGKNFDEEIFMPIVFKTIRAALASPEASWKHVRATVMAVSQVVEHIEDDMAYVDQCVDFIAQHFANPHPRVRYAAFLAAGQVCYDHADHVAAEPEKVLLPAFMQGMKDDNIRVATTAVNSFSALAEELDIDDIESFMEPALAILFERLGSKESRIMQEHCLSGIAAIAEIAEEEFVVYYGTVVPMLKQVIANATTVEERSLRGKAFVCVALIGAAVGKETFEKDAHEVMEAMLKVTQAGFEADDPQKESVQEASGKIAQALGKDFKVYIPALLPGIFTTLSERPGEVDPPEDEDDERDMSLRVIGGKVLGLRTSLIVEMEAALDQVNTFIKALSEDYCEFMPQTCQNLLPLLEFQLSDNLRDKAFETLELLVGCARQCLDSGRLDINGMRELLSSFLTKIVGAMATTPTGEDLVEVACGTLQAQAVGLTGIIMKAGEGVLTGDVVKDIAAVVVRLLDQIRCGTDTEAKPGMRRRKGTVSKDEARDDEEVDVEEHATAQSASYCLADTLHALMTVSREPFAEMVLPTLMEFVQTLLQMESNDACRGLAYYIADDVVDVMGDKSVPYWNWLMNLALKAGTDKCAVVRQYSTSTIGNGSRLKVFQPMAAASASQVCSVLSKQGERHRRRRAVKADSKQNALAVDACIRTLGMICEHHEEALGTHAQTGWSIWLANLPMRYDVEAARKTHAQLLGLLARRHPSLMSPEQQAKFLGVLADIYKTSLSTTALDKDIASAVAQIGEAPIKQLSSAFSEFRQKKVEQMLKAATRAGGA